MTTPGRRGPQVEKWHIYSPDLFEIRCYQVGPESPALGELIRGAWWRTEAAACAVADELVAEWPGARFAVYRDDLKG